MKCSAIAAILESCTPKVERELHLLVSRPDFTRVLPLRCVHDHSQESPRTAHRKQYSGRYVIEIIAFILVAPVVFLSPPLLPRWARDDPDLRFIGWFALTTLCLLTIGVIRGWADRRKNK